MLGDGTDRKNFARRMNSNIFDLSRLHFISCAPFVPFIPQRIACARCTFDWRQNPGVLFRGGNPQKVACSGAMINGFRVAAPKFYWTFRTGTLLFIQIRDFDLRSVQRRKFAGCIGARTLAEQRAAVFSAANLKFAGRSITVRFF